MTGRFSIEAIFRMVDRITNPLGKMQARMDRFAERTSKSMQAVSKVTDKVSQVVRKVAIVASAAMAAAGAALYSVIRPATDVADAMAKLQTVTTPLTTMEDALAESKAAAIAWSKQHVQSATEFIGAEYNMASAGLNNAQALAGTTAALTLATATMGDATTAGNLLATVYNNLGDRNADVNTEMTRLSDVLAKTQALFQIADLSQLNESLKMGAPAAIQYGQSIEQLSNVVGALNTAGLQGSMAGTAYSASLRQMSKASKELHFAMAKTATGGIDFVGTLKNIEAKYGTFAQMTDAQKDAFQKAFGDEGVRAVALMLGKSDQLATSLDAVTNSAGEAAKAAQIIESRGSGPWTIMKNRITAVAIQLGDALLPAFEKLKPEIDKIVSAVSTWIEQNKDLIATKFTQFVQEAIPVIKEFALGIKDGFDKLLPIIEPVAKAIIGLFGGSGGKDRNENAYTLGRNIVLAAGAFFALSTALNVASGAIFAYQLVSGIATKATAIWTGVTTVAQGVAGWTAMAFTGMSTAMLGIAAAAGAAVGAVMLLVQQLSAFKAENDGLGFGEMAGEWLTSDKSAFEIVDQHMNNKAKARATKRDDQLAKAIPGQGDVMLPTQQWAPPDVSQMMSTLDQRSPTGSPGLSGTSLPQSFTGSQMPQLSSMPAVPGMDPMSSMPDLSALENLQVTGPAQITLPEGFDARQLEDSMTITVKDETAGGKAEITKKPASPKKKLKLQQTGA